MVFIRIFLFLFTVNRFVLFLRLWNLIIRKSCPNNLNYITTKFTKTFCNHFLNQKSKTPSHWYLLGRTSGGFCDADLYFVVIINLSSLVDVFYFVVVSSFDFQATLPCHRHSTLVSQAHDGLQQLWALPRLLLIASFFFIYRERYGFEWAFFIHRRFLSYASSRHFGTTCFYQGFTGRQQLLSWSL